jgi:hypothetical protein
MPGPATPPGSQDLPMPLKAQIYPFASTFDRNALIRGRASSKDIIDDGTESSVVVALPGDALLVFDIETDAEELWRRLVPATLRNGTVGIRGSVNFFPISRYRGS